MENHTKFVDFYYYCKLCEHQTNDENEPCNTCLETCAREVTDIPTEFKEK